METQAPESECPTEVAQLAAQAVEYVRRAVGLSLEYDSDTLPILDHYLRSVPAEHAASELVAVAAGAYFGEVVRRRLGGTWDTSGEPESWRLVLPGGMWFSPAAVTIAAIEQKDGEAAILQAPESMQPHLESALERMADVSEHDYYSLCGRFDTLEHLQSVLLAVAAEEMRRRQQKDAD